MAFIPDRYSFERRRTRHGRSLYEIHDALIPGRIVATLTSGTEASMVVAGLNEDARREAPAATTTNTTAGSTP